MMMSQYLHALDAAVKSFFFPPGCENRDFSTMKEQFYDLKGILRRTRNLQSLTFRPPVEPSFLKDLEYACRRINETEAGLSDNKKVWFSV
jgi:hypothetical protein